MSVSNGSPATASTFNNAFVSKITDSTTTAVITLDNTSDVNSGDTITNTQRYINEIADSDGTVGEGDSSRTTYSSNNIVSNGDSRKVAIGKLDAEFDASTGHAHTGAAGEGPVISAATLSNFNNYNAAWQTFTQTGSSGTSVTITTEMSGKTAGGGTSAAGVVTSGAYNRCEVKDSSLDTYLEDAGGQRVYGRITESAGTWTLSFYTNEAGSETAHSLASTNIRVYFKEIFTAATRPTLADDIGLVGSLDLTADIIDAGASTSGKLTASTQTIGGLKTFNDQIQNEKEIILKEVSTPSSPSAGYFKLYPKTDKLLYYKDSDGTEALVSTGGAATVYDSPVDTLNFALTASVAANAMTIALKTKSLNDPSGGNPVKVSFRNVTAATGDYELVSATAATSIVISSGSTLGSTNGNANWVYVYAINNGGTIELAVSGSKMWGEGSVQSTTAEGGAGAADSKTVLYSTTARTSKAIRLIGRIKSTQATAGTWASSPSEISLPPFELHAPRSEVWYYTANGYGSTNTKIRRWTTSGKNIGTAITYADSSTAGSSFTINEDGLYSIYYSDQTSGNDWIGISLNSSQLTTSVQSITATDRIAITKTIASAHSTTASITVALAAGDVIRPHSEGVTSGASTFAEFFRITKVSH